MTSMTHNLMVTLLCGSLLVPSAATWAQPPTSLTDGARLYGRWCAACHDPGPGHPGTQALEALYQGRVSAVLAQREGLDVAFVTATVRSGRSVMPSFRRTELSDTELRALAQWLALRPGG